MATNQKGEYNIFSGNHQYKAHIPTVTDSVVVVGEQQLVPSEVAAQLVADGQQVEGRWRRGPGG